MLMNNFHLFVLQRLHRNGWSILSDAQEYVQERCRYRTRILQYWQVRDTLSLFIITILQLCIAYSSVAVELQCGEG